MTEIVLATTKPAKSERLAAICAGLPLSLIDGAEMQDAPVADEPAASHMGIAVKKAIVWSRHYSAIALASDGGLVIPALAGDWESTLTRRSTGEEVPDEERARRLLARMRGLTGVGREAYWAEAIALARDGVLICAWETDGLRGAIGQEYRPNPRGPTGFWADGLWEGSDGRKRWEHSSEERAEGADPWSRLEGSVRAVLAELT